MFTSKRKLRKCPKCGSKKVADILYGIPDFSRKLEKDLNDGKLVLVGCCQEVGAPLWKCVK